MGFLGFGKSKKEKEIEADLEFFTGLHLLLVSSAGLNFLQGNSERKQVIMALFFRYILNRVFNKYGMESIRSVYEGFLDYLKNDDFLKDKGFEDKHLKIGSELLNRQDEKANSILKSASKVFDCIKNGEDYKDILNDILWDKSIKWQNISDEFDVT